VWTTIPAKIAVFDLEMPSARRDAISAVGITLIEDGKITRSYDTLVDPECPFDPFTVELTGITPAMAAAYPNFGDLWEEMRPWFDGALLCAHGASGDLHVLARTLRRYGIEWVDTVPFLCTVETAKQCFPDQERYALHLLSAALGIENVHHVASSDAAAAAQILLKCLKIDPTLPDRAKEFDMKEAHIVGVTKKRRRRKTGAALNVENELKKLVNKRFAAERRVQFRDQSENILGVKAKSVKKLARRIARSAAAKAFLEDLPHTYLEEDLLHAYLLDEQHSFETCLAMTEAFLPYIDNDDVFFACKPKALLRHGEAIVPASLSWIESDHSYTVAFGIRMLSQRINANSAMPDETEIATVAGLHLGHPTVALAAADYFFRLLKYGGEEAEAAVRSAAEGSAAAMRGLYFYEKDAEALATHAE
jgi:DNA polymerase III epsilon subunit-like protein